MINGYLYGHGSLMLAFVLIDPNIPPTKIDVDFINGLGENEIPFALVFTKADKLGVVKVQQNIDLFMAELSKTWETLPPYFISSAERRTGKTEILTHIERILKTKPS